MKIRKYTGKTEKEAILKVKEELGGEALIVSIKTVKPRGIFRLFRKAYIEVTAALDDRPMFSEEQTVDENPDVKTDPSLFDTKLDEELPVKTEEIGDEVESLAILEEEQIVDEQLTEKIEKNKEFVKAIYEHLIENEVLEKHVNQLTEGAYNLFEEEDNKDIVAVIYKRIVSILSDYETINSDNKVIFFIGPTGVGKTTTIAKIASYFSVNKGLKVALITSDTYRIAAVEQLRTYANILGIPLRVIYKEDELVSAIDSFEDFDLVFVDTAGRSHRNEDRKDELNNLLNAVDNKDVYLVLSAATKYKDLKSITGSYDDICDYKIIFTKLDETMSYGNILNIKLLTQAKLSYVTFGQNVPEDISEVRPHDIAKNILGGVR